MWVLEVLFDRGLFELLGCLLWSLLTVLVLVVYLLCCLDIDDCGDVLFTV